MKLHAEHLFPIVLMGKKDTLAVTYRHYNKETGQWEKYITTLEPGKARQINCIRVYTTNNFDGLTDVILCVLGYKAPEST